MVGVKVGCVGVIVGDKVIVAVRILVAVGVNVPVSVAVGESVAVKVSVGVRVKEGVALKVGEDVGVNVGVDVGRLNQDSQGRYGKVHAILRIKAIRKIRATLETVRRHMSHCPGALKYFNDINK